VSPLKCGELRAVGINEAPLGRRSYLSGKFIRHPLGKKLYPQALNEIPSIT
jgi:hypothetical protein